jgi:YafQ family addiction module toxin component|tara:strand:- start:153 stop:413 length:261 start_codon:yes stop_codon:yes gene_type:complete
MYSLATKPNIDKIFSKIGKKNPRQMRVIFKKIEQIVENPYHFKPLRGDMKGSRRVHIDKSFVLTYEVDEKNKIVRLLDYDHHDNIY